MLQIHCILVGEPGLVAQRVVFLCLSLEKLGLALSLAVAEPDCKRGALLQLSNVFEPHAKYLKPQAEHSQVFLANVLPNTNAKLTTICFRAHSATFSQHYSTPTMTQNCSDSLID